MEERRIYSLHTILKGIRDYLEVRIKGKLFWLKVELANINFHNSGHCYLELAETRNGQCIAQCRGSIWKSSLESIQKTLGSDFTNIIKKGNEILCLVEVQFTELYGLNFIIRDVDINFSLGALEKKKQQTIERLVKENLLDKNKQIKLPLVIQKVAIIGSPETAGITDLIKQLDNNIYQFHFDYKVLSCTVQGEKAEGEIIERLRQLNDSSFDVVALVRGGGSKLDLDVFNSYNISKEIALHKKPVFTGIGHETDVSIVDLVANVSHKTPSALGSYIVDRVHNFEINILNIFNAIVECKNRSLEDRKSNLILNIQTLTSQGVHTCQRRRADLHTIMNRIIGDIRQLVFNEKSKLNVGQEMIKTNPRAYIQTSRGNLIHTMELMQINSDGKIRHALEGFKQTLDLVFSYSNQIVGAKSKYVNNMIEIIDVYHPDNILKKGYAIPRLGGELITNQSIQENSEVEIELYRRILVVKYQKDKRKWKNLIMNRLLKN